MRISVALAAFSLLIASFDNGRADSSEPQLLLDTGGHIRSVFAVALTLNGKQLVSASLDSAVRVWDLDTSKSVRTILEEGGPSVRAMALSPDGRWLALGGNSRNTDPAASDIARLYGFASVRL